MTASATHSGVKPGYLIAASAIIAAACFSPLPWLALERFSAQAAMHVVLVCIAAPLLAASVAGSHWDPVRRWPQGFSPLAISLLQGAVVWAWHAPALQLAARSAPPLLWLQQGSFLIAAVLLWVSVLGGDRETRYERVGAGIIALLLTSVHMTLLGGLSLISRRSAYFSTDLASSFDDRYLGGLLTLAGAGVVYAVAGGMLLAWLLRPGPHAAESVRGALPR